VREKGRWRTRAGCRRDGAFDERDDGFAGATSFAAYADRDSGFAFLMEALQLFVPAHVHQGNRLHDLGAAPGASTPKSPPRFA
jgi:hypothetical protein